MATTGTDTQCPRNPDRDLNQIVSRYLFLWRWKLYLFPWIRIFTFVRSLNNPNFFQTLLTAMWAGCRIPTQATTSQTSCSGRPGPWTAPPTPASASAATTPRTWGPWLSTTRATPPPPAAWYGRSSCRHVWHVWHVITRHSCVQWSVRAPLVCDKNNVEILTLPPHPADTEDVNNSSEDNNSRIQSKSKY